jgi:hypothetical protein
MSATLKKKLSAAEPQYRQAFKAEMERLARELVRLGFAGVPGF